MYEKEIKKKMEKSEIDDCYELFQQFVKEGQLEKALELINENNYRGMLKFGVSYAEKNKNNVAEKIFGRLTQIASVFEGVWYNRGLILSKLGKCRDALDCFNQATQINPKFAEAWYARGVTLSRLGKHGKTLRSLRKAFQINPGLQDAEFKGYLQDLELVFRSTIERIADFYEWDQCDEKFYRNFTNKEWTLFESIQSREIMPNQNPNTFMWIEPLHRSLLKKFWHYSRIYQRTAFIDTLSADEREIVKDCLPHDEIREILPPSSDFFKDNG